MPAVPDARAIFRRSRNQHRSHRVPSSITGRVSFFGQIDVAQAHPAATSVDICGRLPLASVA